MLAEAILGLDSHDISNYLYAIMAKVNGMTAKSAADLLEGETVLMARQLAVKENYVLFQSSDMSAWLVFLLVFFLLVGFDNFVLHREAKVISFSRACCYSIFWLFCGVCWNVYVYYHRGFNGALAWSTGYVLEWMLSMDCLFFFHIIFKMLGTPDHLKCIPLFWGIMGAIFFRIFLFALVEGTMHSFYWTHLVFGLFLIYTGFKSATLSEEHFDPRENSLFRFLCKYIRMVNAYDDGGNMFVRVKVDKSGEPIMPERSSAPVSKDLAEKVSSLKEDTKKEEDLEKVHIYTADQFYSSTDLSENATWQWRGTLLVVVVMCIMITDLIFAVDSVSAIVAEIPDLFLAYTASVFAVLNLRAMFFVTDQLIRLFTLLKYGIASILVIIGLKLILKEWVTIPPFVILGVLIAIVAGCIIGSLILNRYRESRERQEEATASAH